MSKILTIVGFTALLVLDLIALLLAQMDVALTFAETWGCRFWTIEMSMVSLCGFTMIWLVTLMSQCTSGLPPVLLLRLFLLFGSVTHIPPASQTLYDYTRSATTPVSEYCHYSSMTMAVAVLELISGILHFVMIFVVRAADGCICDE